MDAEIWILYNFHMSQNVIVPQSLKNVENIFCLWALQKQAVGWISLRGHSLLVPAWYKI